MYTYQYIHDTDVLCTLSEQTLLIYINRTSQHDNNWYIITSNTLYTCTYNYLLNMFDTMIG